jgi:hypothetical protein
MGQIWRVSRQRPWSQRLLLYWAGLTLGPLLLGGSLAISSYLFTGYLSGLGDWLPVSVRNLLDLVEFALLVACVTGLYYYLPNTRVDWRHALTGGVAVAFGLELAKKGLASLLGANAKLLGHLWRFRSGAHSVGMDLCHLGGGFVGRRDHSQPARNWSSIEAHRRWAWLVISAWH